MSNEIEPTALPTESAYNFPTQKFTGKWFIIACTMLVLGGLVSFDVYEDRAVLIKNEQDRLMTQTKVIGSNIEHQLQSVSMVMHSVAANLDDNHLNERLSEFTSAIPGIRTLVILNKEGIVTASNRRELINENFSTRDYFTAPRSTQKTDQLYVSPPFKGVLNAYIITLSIIIPGADGSFNGIIGASLDPDYFQVLLESVLYSDGMWSSVIHGDGLLFLQVPGTQGTPGLNLAVPGSFYTRHTRSGKNENIFTGSSYLADSKRIAAARTVNKPQLKLTTPFIIVVSRDLESVTFDWKRDSFLKIISVVLLGCFLSFGTVLLQRRQKKLDEQEMELLKTQVLAQSELRSSQEWQKTFDAVHDSICVINTEGRISRCNEATLAITGADHTQVTDRHCWEIFHGTSGMHQNCPAAQAKMTGTRVTSEIVVGDRHLEISVDPLHTSENILEGFVHIVRDVTEKRRTLSLLQENEALVQSVMNSIQSSIVVLDPDGVVLKVNQAWGNFAAENGGTPALQRGIGMNYFDVCNLAAISEPDVLNVINGIKAVQQGEKKTYSVEYPCHGPGVNRWFILYVSPLSNSFGGVVLTHLNITERVLAQEKLAETNELFKLFMRHSPVYAYIKEVTATESRVLMATDNFIDMVGVPATSMIGKVMDDLFPPEHAKKFTEEDWAVVCSGKVMQFEEELNGRYFTTIKFPIVQQGKTLLAGYTIDITKRKLAEEAIKLKDFELEQFTYSVSHDLRSPLVTVKTFLGYLEQDMASENQERVVQDMDFIRGAANKMEVQLNELLEFSRIGRLENQSVKVSSRDIGSDACALLAGTLSETHAVVDISPHSVTLYGDRQRFAQIWQNLLENAIKYRDEKTAPRVEFGIDQSTVETRFFVRDNGMGIDPVYHDKIFGLFEKLDSNSTGAGLGLAMVKKVVELYGGRIWVESAGTGQGSCFWFTLPNAVIVSE